MVTKKLYKNANWKALKAHIQESFPSIKNINPMINLNNFMLRLTKVVLKSIKLSVLIAKTSPYNKR